MNENINLYKLLKGCEGMKFYCSYIDKMVTLTSVINNYIMICDSQYGISFLLNNKGQMILDITVKQDIYDDECILFPSKDQRDWSKFVKPIPINTPMVVSDDKNSFCIRYYSGKIGWKHHVFMNMLKGLDMGDTRAWNYMIPFDKFNPNNIEESLKYNIQK